MPKQQILLTTMPRGASIDPPMLPFSVLVSPRLTDGTTLAEFPDWLHWTERLKDQGLTLELACNGRRTTVNVATDQLRADLWSALFKNETLVRPYQFDDHSQRSVFSFPLRLALSSIKGTYQRAGLDLALPDSGGAEDERGLRYRRALAAMLDGMQLNWDEHRAAARRQAMRDRIKRKHDRGAASPLMAAEDLGPDGLLLSSRMPAAGSAEARTFNQQFMEPFGIFSHPPQGPALDDLPPPDWHSALDFHQVLAALNNYPNLQRALGLVFDIDVPLDFIPVDPSQPFVKVHVARATPGWDWDVVPKVPPLDVAVVHGQVAQQRLFFCAPRNLVAGTSELPSVGLLALDPQRFGLAQVDVDGALHKAITLSETLSGLKGPQPLVPPHTEVFDSAATLPALRSGGLSLFADGRAEALMGRFDDSKAFNDALRTGQQQRPFAAEDLVRGYRLDVWDSATRAWHSLHRRRATYTIEDADDFVVEDEEGFVKLAATQASPDPDRVERADDLYLHEAIARWSGWSLSAPMPGKHLSRYADPKDALPEPGEEDRFIENEAPTPFKMATTFRVIVGTLPRMRFGTRYRMRARLVDLAGNSIAPDSQLAERLARVFALPRAEDGVAYLRFEPVSAPQLVLRDVAAVSAPGGQLERLVIRTFNADPTLDVTWADLSGGDRHIVPPRTSVDIGERLGMFDDADGKLIPGPAMHALIAQRESGQFQHAEPVVIAGQEETPPLEPAARLDQTPYLPDALARGAAFRDLPGMPNGTLGHASPGSGSNAPVEAQALDDPNPRAGSALIVHFGDDADWQQAQPFRLALADGNDPPAWDPMGRILTVFLPKGSTSVVPLSSYLSADDLKLMGVWEWLREYIESRASSPGTPEPLQYGRDVTRIGHVLQRALEGGHWMLTPPRLLTLVHAVQQPLGVPRFVAVALQHGTPSAPVTSVPLETQTEVLPTPEAELATITAWRRLGSTDTWLIGGLEVHGASTEKVDLVAEWQDPVDDPALGPPTVSRHRAPVDEIIIDRLDEHVLRARDAAKRKVGHYVPQKDVVVFAREGDAFGHLQPGVTARSDEAPRHRLGDTRHHVVRYSAIATSRYRDYFDSALDFTRQSEPVEVSVPASARPLAPTVAYALPIFGWQRQLSSSLKHSVRFGGGIRVYLERGWYSSGEGELLGVVLWNFNNRNIDREAWKPFITQWGLDPIWDSAHIGYIPSVENFSGHVASDESLTLEENIPRLPDGSHGVVDVVGYPVTFDSERDQWYCDITLNTFSTTYMPFVRLALARYQPHALTAAKLSRIVLADFVQLSPDRTAVVTANPAQPRELRITVSGPAPRGPAPTFSDSPPPDRIVRRPTEITVTLQEKDPAIPTDLGWKTSADAIARVIAEFTGPVTGRDDLVLWKGRVEFVDAPARDRFRLLIEEHEYPSAKYTVTQASSGAGGSPVHTQPRRLVYAETIALDGAVTQPATAPTTGEGMAAPPGDWASPPDAAYGPYGGPPMAPPGVPIMPPEVAPTEDAGVVDASVKLLQALLNAAGALPSNFAPLTIDGNFGPLTKSALESFQGTHLLPVSGTADAITWYALMVSAPLPQLEPGIGEPVMQGPQIAALQRALNLAGAYPTLDDHGAFDEPTGSALASFQQGRGLTPSGIVDPATWIAIIAVRADTDPAGSVILRFSYDAALDPPIAFVSREDIDGAAPVSESIDWNAIGGSGYVIELHDAYDRPIYRRTFSDPFGLRIEGVAESSSPESPQHVSVPSGKSAGSIELIVPRLPHAVDVVFIGSPLDAQRMDEAGDVLARFALVTLE